MRVLGVDPGLTRCGVGVIDVDRRRRHSFVGVEVLRTAATEEPVQRLLQLEELLGSALDYYQPNVVAIERVFSQLNVRTVMGTAQASAITLLGAGRRSIPTFLYTPTEVKASVTGYGRADKAQVATMVMRLLALTEPPKPADATDALALALCHSMRGLNSMALAVAARGAAR